jgi:hypothetical protein
MSLIDGELCKRWRLLSLLLLRCSGLRSNSTGRCLRTRMPAYRWSFNFWSYTTTRQDRVYLIWTQLLQWVVRKWSYINQNYKSSCEVENLRLNYADSIRPSLNGLGIGQTSRRYNFKVFRKTTRFKKFKSGLAGVVRGVYATRKRRTENYVNLFIARDWAIFYLKQRQIVRFAQSLSLLPYESLASDKEVFFKRLPYVDNIGGVSIYTCSTTFVKALLLRTRNIPYFFFSSSHSVVSHTQSTNLEDLANSSEIGSNSLRYDGLLYPTDSTYFLTNSLVRQLLRELMALLLKAALLVSIEVRKIMTYLVVLSIR